MSGRAREGTAKGPGSAQDRERRLDESPINDLGFRQPKTGPNDVELIALESLYRRNLDAVLERPQRLHFYAILLTTGGRGVHIVDFVEHPYDDHTMIFVAKGQVQQFRIDLDSTGFLLVFTSEFLYRNSTEAHVNQSMRVFDSSLNSPRWTLDDDRRSLFLGLFYEIRREFDRPHDALSEEVLRHLTRLILLQSERMRQALRPDQFPLPTYREYLDFRELVQRDLSRSRSVRYYAERLGSTPHRLNQLTRQVLNKTAKAFIEEEVVNEAHRLLAHSGMPIKEIAYRLGFSEPTNWVKFFKKHTGESPAAFRQRLKL